ncbi:MAG: cobalt ECF transporter T component CbiQ [Euryarchaeota archaeon]|nr:cobalt ECF transporter T component CbiQ [Euryarchaeota archaeon]
MVNYPEIDKYSALDSPMHRFDPRAKIVAFIFLIFAVVLVPNLKLAFIALIGAILFLIASKLPLRFALQHIKWVFLFVVPFVIIMPFTVSGTELFSFYGLTMTYEGLEYGILVAVRAISAVILVLPMIATTRFDITIKALGELKMPNMLVQMFMFTYRYIFVFVVEFQRTWRAMAARGFQLKTNLYALKTIGRALGMLFVRSYERGDRVYQALRARGYTAKPKTLVEFKMRTSDYVWSVVVIGFAVSLLIVSFA